MAISGIGGGFSNLNLTTSAQERTQKLVKQMDTDSDGKVTKQEFAAFGEKMKANGPRRADGGAAATSNGAKAPAPPSADDLFAKADTDGDGSLRVEDLSALLAKHETHAAARGGHQKGGPGGAGGPPPGGPGGGGGPPPGGPGGAGGPPPGGAAGGAGSGPTGREASSSSTDSDPADTDQDGTVSAAEKLAYQLLQQGVSDTSES